MPKIFVIILNWNNQKDTYECIESFENNDYPNYRIVIVDNGSENKLKINNPNIKIIYNQNNLGYAGGNNVGIKYALKNNADYILLLNNDTLVDDNFLTKLIEVGESNPKFGIIGPKIYFAEDKNKLWSTGGKINWLYNKAIMRGYNEIDNKQYDEPKTQKTDFITGCCLLIKKEVINKISLIPEDYFLYYEDIDWCLKTKKAGFKCVFAPEAQIYHKGSQSSVEHSSPYIYYHIRNGLLLSRRFAPFYIKPFIYIDTFWRVGKQIFKIIFIPKKRKWAKYILLGIKDFYFNKFGKNENWY